MCQILASQMWLAMLARVCALMIWVALAMGQNRSATLRRAL